MIRTKSVSDAWQVVVGFVSDGMKIDYKSSERAGYTIYRNDSGDYVCDLGDRYEVNFANGKTVNVWFDATEKPQFVEFRRMSTDALRQLCIKQNWYTRGTVREYENLMSMTRDENWNQVNMTAEKLAKMAADIMAHSEIDEDKDLTCFMYDLAEICHTTFEEA